MIYKSKKILAALVVSFALAPTSFAALTNFSEDFEGLVDDSPSALSDAGWLVFANVFSGANGDFLYNYGVFGAPNGTPGFSSVAVDQGGAAQGAQQLVVYSDYNNGDHANGNVIEAIVFQEQTIDASDVGSSWNFSFDALTNDLEAPSTAIAFIKTLDPSAGFATTNFLTIDTSNISAWDSFTLSILIDGSLAGQILQFGFSSNATNFNPSGVFYDNVQFSQVPVPGAIWLLGSALLGMFVKRKR